MACRLVAEGPKQGERGEGPTAAGADLEPYFQRSRARSECRTGPPQRREEADFFTVAWGIWTASRLARHPQAIH